MAPKSALTEGQKKAIIERIDSAVARIGALHGPEALHECRALFRRRVPLHLRAYVAAALLMDGLGPAGTGKGSRRPEGNGPAKRGEKPREPKRESQRDTQRDTQRGQRPEAQGGRKAEPKAGREPGAKPADQAAPARREQRFMGEGVSVFISAGRRQRLYARVILDMLYELPGVREQSIGELRILDNYSFITIDPAVEELVVTSLNGKEFRGRPLSVNRAKKRDDAPADEQPSGDEPHDGS